MHLFFLRILEYLPCCAAFNPAHFPSWSIWIVLLIVFLIFEAVTVSLVSIWFAVGSLVALILNFAGADAVAQVVTMLVVSLVCLLLFVLRRRNRRDEGHLPTNADRYPGKIARVTREIDPIKGTGQILIEGMVWSAKSAEGETIEADSSVEIVSIRGVHAVVKKVEA